MIFLIILLIGCLGFAWYTNEQARRSLYYYDIRWWQKWHDRCLLVATIILILIFGLLTKPVHGQVIDGDSFYYGGEEYRLACIDAPEYDERLGAVAERYLARWLDKVTRIEEVGKGYYGRTIVFLWADEVLINARLYQNNLAEYNWGYECKYKGEILWTGLN